MGPLYGLSVYLVECMCSVLQTRVYLLVCWDIQTPVVGSKYNKRSKLLTGQLARIALKNEKKFGNDPKPDDMESEAKGGKGKSPASVETAAEEELAGGPAAKWDLVTHGQAAKGKAAISN